MAYTCFRKRDSQRSKVYRAEREVMHDNVRDEVTKGKYGASYHSYVSVPRFGTTLDEIEDVRCYVEMVMEEDWFVEAFPHIRRIDVPKPHARRKSYSTGVVAIYRDGVGQLNSAPGDFHRSEWVIIHELAHIVNTEGTHGPSYCERYLFLVYKLLGYEAFLALLTSFLMHRVKVVDLDRKCHMADIAFQTEYEKMKDVVRDAVCITR